MKQPNEAIFKYVLPGHYTIHTLELTHSLIATTVLSLENRVLIHQIYRYGAYQ